MEFGAHPSEGFRNLLLLFFQHNVSVTQTGYVLKPQVYESHLNTELYLGHTDVFGPIKG